MAVQFNVTIPDNVTPQIYFKELLPKILDNAKKEIPNMGEQDFKMQINVGGKPFGLCLEKGKAPVVSEGDLAGAMIKLEVSEETWKATVTGKIDDQGGFTDFRRAGHPMAVQILKNLKGQLTTVLTRPDGPEVETRITFNGSENPKAKMKLSLQDYLDINSKKANGQMLFMQGRIMVEGDMGLIMQLQPLQNL